MMKNLLNRWFIDGMSFMALGLFSSLIIGLILKTIGQYIEVFSALTDIGELAMSLAGAAIGAAIAVGLKSPPLIIFSSVIVGQAAYIEGGVAGAYITMILIIEIARLYQKRTPIDILVSPFLTIVIGVYIGKFFGPYVSKFMSQIGEFINFATTQNPFLMGMLVAVVFGVVLTAPISSAGLAIMLDISGLAAGAAVIGCCCHMVGLAVTGYKDNGVSGLLSIGVGTSMLQVANIIRNPFIILPPTIASAIIAPIMAVFWPMENNSAGAGMGTSGFVGQIMAIESMGPGTKTWILIAIFHIILPAVVTYILYRVLYTYRLIKDGDQKLNLGS